ncbi:S8 family peptidase [Pedobacter sp. P351]|uniref:S8 family peptidase n=1 Tax=Pedobacter superstes TaxID=3133441 RepID=UPI00309B191E
MNLIRKIVLIGAFVPMIVLGQSKEKPKENWQNLDLQRDGVMGISTERAYELLKGKPSTPVVVAVIDGGVDEEHEDLKAVMWKNTKEIAGNNKDDDKNGYVDDLYGWNFLGSQDGNVRYDNLEVVRLVRKLKDKYASVVNSTPLSEEERKEFTQYKKMVTDYMTRLDNARRGYESLAVIKKITEEITVKIGKPAPSLKDFEKYESANEIESKVLKVIKSEMKKEPDYKLFKKDIDDTYKYYSSQVNYHLNIDYDPRDSVKDDYSNTSNRIYGNSDITGPDAEHGTHVAGIIAAVRGNGIGINGIAGNVRIMGVRTVPDGDERDKDVANAIRYAVDNGAKVINMSFGKAYAWNKAVVDSAVKYAESKDVLLVHAAGNDGKNTDFGVNFPNRIYGNITSIEKPQVLDGRSLQGYRRPPEVTKVIPQDTANAKSRFDLPRAQNWIEVGASGWTNDDNLVASFSNYGKMSVDVFAPGVKVNSTIPGSKYEPNDGTSMASPVVAGLAALIRSYYPSLTAVQVKDIIMKSVTKIDQKVKIKEDGSSKKVKLDEISISGGVVNAYNAIQLASKINNSSL